MYGTHANAYTLRLWYKEFIKYYAKHPIYILIYVWSYEYDITFSCYQNIQHAYHFNSGKKQSEKAPYLLNL